MIFGIYKNDARAMYLDYIEPPFMTDPVAIVVRKGADFAFAEWSDLKGRKGVTNAGESYGDVFDAFMAKELTVARAAGVDKAFAALLAEQADYMIIGLYPGRDEARRLGLADKIAFLPKALLSSAMYVAFSKKSKCGALRPGFADEIQTAVDDGTVRRLLGAAGEGARGNRGQSRRYCAVGLIGSRIAEQDFAIPHSGWPDPQWPAKNGPSGCRRLT